MGIVEKIVKREAHVAVVGLGYVGLPLAVAFAEAGFPVTGIDLDSKRVASIRAGRSFVTDVPSERLSPLVTAPSAGGNSHSASPGAPQSGSAPQQGAAGGVAAPVMAAPPRRLTASTDFDALASADAVVICVPTPLAKTKEPDLSFIISAIDRVAERMHASMLVALESTTYPGTTQELLLPRFQAAGRTGKGLRVGEDFFLAFSPERIDPGRKDWTLKNTPKVIGGVTPRCLEAAKALYGSIVDTVVPVSSTQVAEMVKLLENTFRAVNIGLVNEIAIICNRLDIDVWEVINAAKTKPFGFMSFSPGPGLGGHCIPIDPEYLAWKLRSLNYTARFIQLAADVNFGMPRYVLEKISDALNHSSKAVNGSKVLILGVTYKSDVSDIRESPALELTRLLVEKGALVSYHDPYVATLQTDGISLSSIELSEKALREADCVVVTAAHRSYDWRWIVDNSRLIVDTRNATSGIAPPGGRVIKI